MAVARSAIARDSDSRRTTSHGRPSPRATVVRRGEAHEHDNAGDEAGTREADDERPVPPGVRPPRDEEADRQQDGIQHGVQEPGGRWSDGGDGQGAADPTLARSAYSTTSSCVTNTA